MTVEPDVASAPLADLKRGIPLGYAFAATGAILFSTKAIIVKLAYGIGVEPDTLLSRIRCWRCAWGSRCPAMLRSGS
jgi:hypothetical protein